MPEPLLQVLKLCLLVLLYLFFLRVLRAVWSEVNGPRVVATPTRREKRPAERRRGKGRSTHLAVVEPADQRGRTFDLGGELTVGRAAGCQITLDDSYASQLHARLFVKDGILYVEDLGSTNGTYLNTRKVSGPMAMKHGDRLKIGATVMEVRG